VILPEFQMRLVSTAFAALITMSLIVLPAAAQQTATRPQLIAALEQNCYSNHANSDPSIKAQCSCYAKTFVDSLTPGEIAVPKRSAEINRKLAVARQTCHLGQN
jgi:hypothetical protein